MNINIGKYIWINWKQEYKISVNLGTLLLCGEIFGLRIVLISWFVTYKTRWVPLVEHELFSLPEHTSSTQVFSGGVRVTQSLVFGVPFCRSLFVFLSFLFWPPYCLPFNLRLLITPLGYEHWHAACMPYYVTKTSQGRCRCIIKTYV